MGRDESGEYRRRGIRQVSGDWAQVPWRRRQTPAVATSEQPFGLVCESCRGRTFRKLSELRSGTEVTCDDCGDRIMVLQEDLDRARANLEELEAAIEALKSTTG